MASAYDELLSKQYHSIRFYNGTYTTVNVPYRIGNTTQTIAEEQEKFFDTWIDARLIPGARPTVSIPSPNSKLVNIPGRKDPINMTSYLTGHITYGNRTGSWGFLMDNDFVERKGGFVAFQNDIQNKLHGRVRKIVLVDEPDYFYVGTIAVSSVNPGASRSTINISSGNLYPFKKEMTSSMDLWKFDEFNFEDGIIQYMKDMTVDGERSVKIYGGVERISPHISGTAGLTIVKDNVNFGSVPTAAIDSQKSIIPRFVINEGLNQVTIKGKGTVSIDYRRGLL